MRLGGIGLLLCFICLILPCCVSAAPSQRYHITDLGPAENDWPVSINNRTQVVGTYYTNHPIATMPDHVAYHAFLWQRGRRRDLGALGRYPNSSASGINDRGQITGTLDATGEGAILVEDYRVFLWEHGRMHNLGAPAGYSLASATAIDNQGWILGEAIVSQWPNQDDENSYWKNVKQKTPRVFLLHGKTWKVLPMSDSQGMNQANGLSDRRQIVGAGWTAINGNGHALLWQKGRMIDLGGPSARAVALNTKRQVVVEKSDQLFLWHRGTAMPLPLPPGDTINQHIASPYAINNRGQIVGTVQKQVRQDTEDRAMLWQNGNVFDLNTLIPHGSGWILQEATGINARGQIVGIGLHHSQAHAYLLTPRWHLSGVIDTIVSLR